MGTQKEFFEIYKQFEHVPSQKFASPAPYITTCTVVYITCPLLRHGTGQKLKSRRWINCDVTGVLLCIVLFHPITFISSCSVCQCTGHFIASQMRPTKYLL